MDCVDAKKKQELNVSTINIRPSPEHHACIAIIIIIIIRDHPIAIQNPRRLTRAIGSTTHALLINTISGPTLTFVVRVGIALGVFIVITLISWIPSLVIETNFLVGLNISSRENSEKGFVDVSFVDVTGIKAAVGVAGVILSFDFS